MATQCDPDFMLIGFGGTAVRRQPLEFRITRAVRAGIREALEDSDYDADTLRIARDGSVFARTCADKTPGIEDYEAFVSHASLIVDQAGKRHEGW